MSNYFYQIQTKAITIHLVVLLSIVFFTYGITNRNKFVYDDNEYILDNYQVKKITNIPEIFKASFPPDEPNIAFYRPITIASYAIDYFIWQDNPAGFHFTNLLIHLANTFLVYAIILSIASLSGIAFIGALLFAIHPVHTEAVAWISGRADILSSLFSFLSILLYINFSRAKGKFKFIYLVFSVFSFGIGFLAKEMSIAILPIIILYDFIKPTAQKDNRKFISILINIKYYVIYAILFVALCYLRYSIIGGFASTSQLDVFTPQDNFLIRLFTMGKVGLKYLQLTIFPVILTIVYEFEIVRPPFTLIEIIPTILFLGIGILGIFLTFINSRNCNSISEEYDGYQNRKLTIPSSALIGFGTLWFYISLLPVTNIVPVGEFLAERYLYFPSAGYCLITGILFFRITRKIRLKKTVTIIFLGFVLYLSALCVYKNLIWYDNKTLWSYESALHPKSAKAQNGYAMVLFEKGNVEESIKYFENAVSTDPNFYLAYNNLGIAFNRLKEYERAELCFKKTLEIYPDFIDAEINLGNLYIHTNNIEKAKSIFDQLAKKFPNNIKVLLHIGYMHYNEGDLKTAQQIFNKILEVSPENYYALYYLGQIYKSYNEINTAKEFFLKSKAANPNFPTVHLTLAEIFQNEKKHNNAIQEYKNYLRLKSDDALAHYNLANEYLAVNKFSPAERHYKMAIKLNSNLIKAYINLGTLCVIQGRQDEARQLWEKALELDPNNKNAKENLEKLKKQ